MKETNIKSEKIEKPTHQEFFISVTYGKTGFPIPFLHSYKPENCDLYNRDEVFRIELPVKGVNNEKNRS